MKTTNPPCKESSEWLVYMLRKLYHWSHKRCSFIFTPVSYWQIAASHQLPTLHWFTNLFEQTYDSLYIYTQNHLVSTQNQRTQSKMYPSTLNLHISSYQYQLLLKSIIVSMDHVHTVAKPTHTFETCSTIGKKTVCHLFSDFHF